MLRTTAQHITKQIRALPKCLWPITRLTILLTILAVALCAGASALVIQYISNKPVPKTSSNPTSNSDGSLLCFSGQPSCPLPSNTSTPTQSTSPQSTPPQSNNSTKSGTSAQSNPGCVHKEIPYKTIYEDASYLQKGQTKVSDGANGFILDCGDGKPVVANPVNKTIYVGTAPTDEEVQQQQIAAQQALDAKQHQWDITYSNAYQSCMTSLSPQIAAGLGDWAKSTCSDRASQQAGPKPL
jgi:hypothetical protein